MKRKGRGFTDQNKRAISNEFYSGKQKMCTFIPLMNVPFICYVSSVDSRKGMEQRL
jgi:hypothetical protein